MKQYLGLLLALLQLSWTSVAGDNTSATGKSCRARAWVRSPDLNPGQVIQGDVKVKLDGACEDVSGYSLRLRFAERAWVKTRRDGVALPEPPDQNPFEASGLPRAANSDKNLWIPMQMNGPPIWNEYQDKDPALWLVREEERIGFEAKYSLREGQRLGHNLIESFAILVPTTNYPPAFSSPLRRWNSERDDTHYEHIYAYFVDVMFANGTSHTIPAGQTSFNAQMTAVSPAPETINFTTIRPYPPDVWGGDIKETPQTRDEFTLEVTFPYGRHIRQGSLNNITVVSHQIGPGFRRPARLDGLSVYSTQTRHWAASLATNDEAAEKFLRKEGLISQLKPTNPTLRPMDVCSNYDLENPKFSQDGIVENGTMFSTKLVNAQFRVQEDCYPPFRMYYLRTEVELLVWLAVHDVMTEEPTLESKEDYDWTPTMEEKWRPYETLQVKIPLFVYPKRDKETERVAFSPVHYLSPEARAPVFVDPFGVSDLLQKSAKDRDSLAPKAQAIFVTPPSGDMVPNRYFEISWGVVRPGGEYVGDTWLRKVVTPNKEKESVAEGRQATIESY